MFMGRKSISAVLAASLSLSGAPSVMAASAAHRVAAAHVTLDTGSANGHHRWRHRDRISGDDIIRGIGIVTGILILADVAGRTAERAERRAEERQRNDDRAEDGPVASPAANDAGEDVGTAVALCSEAAERSKGDGAKVSEIDAVTREGSGWKVEGSLRGGGNVEFTCGTTSGRIDYVRLGDSVT